MAKIKLPDTIKFRFTVTYGLLLAMGLVLISWAVISIVGNHLVSQRLAAQDAIFQTAAESVTDCLAAADTEGLFSVTDELAKDLGGRVLLLDTNRTALLDTLSEYNGVTFRLTEVDRILNGQAVSLRETHSIKDAKGYIWTAYYCRSITVGGRIAGVLVASVPIQDVYDSIYRLALYIILVTVGVAGCIVGVQLAVTGRIARQINSIISAIRKIDKGDFSARVTIHSQGELAELASSYNSMIQRLENIENSRNKFVSDASHELKTPLASIKILVDALLQQKNASPELYREFLTDVTTEIDRLNYVINDLLTLVRIDKKSEQLTLVPVKLSEILTRSLHLLTPIANMKSISLELEVGEEITLACDQMKLQQAFYNIVENAIKYSPEDSKVSLKLLRRGTDAVVEIADQGVGIPQEDLPHIFERFYRVDRSRKKGNGTGLGLAITDGIIKLHNGQIEVESKVGEGSVFRVVLPIR